MTVTINGDPMQLAEGLTVARLLADRQIESRLVVVERNGVIIARDDYAGVLVEHDDVLEIVQMMAGG